MLLDSGIGLLIAALFGITTITEPSITLIVVGLVGALWPDTDFPIWLLRGNKLDQWAHQHRDLLHRPLVFTPLLVSIVWPWLGWQAGVIFIVGSLCHFLHDLPIGWGILAFWPFDKRYWAYKSYGDQPTRLYAWTKEEQYELCAQHGNPNWLKEGYGSLSKSIIVEFVMLAIGILSVVIWYQVFP